MNNLIKFGALAGGILLIAKGFDNRLEITKYTVESDRLPKEFDGFKIAHLSDLHCESMPELFGAVSSLEPDIIVCTGDMADDYGSYEVAVSETAKLTNIAPVYHVSGNHDTLRNDFPEFVEEIRASGASFLRNERVKVTRGDSFISLSGLSDPFSYLPEPISANIDASLKELGDPEGFDILLFHRANLLDKLKNLGYPLILAGHMHGGQMRIPAIGGVFSPKSSFWGHSERMVFPKYFGGKYSHENTQMIVSRGLGNPMVIPRVFNRPELVLVTLKCK